MTTFSLMLLTALVTWFVTITIPHIWVQYQRSKAFKQQEFIDFVERIVDNKLKQIIEEQ